MDAKQRPNNARGRWSKAIVITVSRIWEKNSAVVG
jgi:hypothetical protein